MILATNDMINKRMVIKSREGANKQF
jgi:hypothetical protein